MDRSGPRGRRGDRTSGLIWPTPTSVVSAGRVNPDSRIELLEGGLLFMSDLTGLVAASAVLHRVRAGSKADLLQQMAEASSAAYGLNSALVLEGALERERLGGTGVEDGVAIPHARLRGLERPCGVAALLDSAIDFDAPDRKPADLVVLLLSPDDAGADHLKALALITRVLRRGDLRQALRGSRTAAAFYALLSQSEPSKAA